jgi:O-antigen/teichoic acid export membrane protein
LGRLLQFALLWIAARTLGPDSFGDFTFALSIGYMLAQVADFGLQLYVQRELARLAIPDAKSPPYFTDDVAAGRLVGGGLALKALLSTVAMFAIVLLVAVQPVGNKAALLLVGLSMVLTTGLEYLAYCFRALRRLQNEAFANVLGRSVNLLLGVGLLYTGGGVWGLAIAGNVAIVAALIFSYRQLALYVRPLWHPDWAYWRRMAWQPTAMGLGIVFSIISFRLDNLLIVPMLDRASLGVYNAAYRLFEPSLIIPSVILAATFPLLSQAAASNHRFREVISNTMLILFGLGALASSSMFLLATPVVGWLGPEYAASGPLLQILALACLPMYLNYGLTHALIATDRPQAYAAFTFMALLVNLGTNLVLIPRMGLEGAAFATFLTEAALLVLCGSAVLTVIRNPRRQASLTVQAGHDAKLLPAYRPVTNTPDHIEPLHELGVEHP